MAGTRSWLSFLPSLLVCEGCTHVDTLALSSPIDSQEESSVHTKECWKQQFWAPELTQLWGLLEQARD